MYINLIKNNRAFRSLLVRDIISAIGSSFSNTAKLALLISLWNNPIAPAVWYSLGGFLICISSILSGNLIDKFDYVKIIALCDTFAMIVSLMLIVASYSHSLVLFFTMSIGTLVDYSISYPASEAFLPKVVSKDQISTANTMTESVVGLLWLLSIGIGGFFTSVMGNVPSFAVDAASYFIAACIMATFLKKSWYRWIDNEPSSNLLENDVIGINEIEPTTNNRIDINTIDINTIESTAESTTNSQIDRIKTEIKNQYKMFMETITYLRTHKYAFNMILIKSWENLSLAAIYVTNIYLSAGMFTSLNHMSGTVPLPLAICYSMASIGGVVSPIIGNYITNEDVDSMIKWLILGLLPCSLGVAVIGVSPYCRETCWIFGNFAFDFGNFVLFVFTKSILQKTVDEKIRGRVFTMSNAFRVTSTTLSSIVMGIIIRYGGNTGIFITMSLMTCLWVAVICFTAVKIEFMGSVHNTH